MHNLYGNRKLNAPEIKGSFTLSNGMYCVWGNTKDEGLAVDIYDDKTKKLLIGLEHNIQTNMDPNDIDQDALQSLIEGFADELEDSAVYYYGPREKTFEKEDFTRPIPKKTGRFA